MDMFDKWIHLAIVVGDGCFLYACHHSWWIENLKQLENVFMSCGAWKPRHISDQSIQFPRRRGDYKNVPTLWSRWVTLIRVFSKSPRLFGQYANVRLRIWALSIKTAKLKKDNCRQSQRGFFAMLNQLWFSKRVTAKLALVKNSFVFGAGTMFGLNFFNPKRQRGNLPLRHVKKSCSGQQVLSCCCILSLRLFVLLFFL